MLKTGTLLDGKYRIVREIGRGGMSVVYLAVNERVNKTWALKEVRKEPDGWNRIRAQSMAAEIEVLKKLHHPNLPEIIDVIDFDDSYVIVMEYIEGKTLKRIMAQYGPQNEKHVVAWAKQLCDALDYLHNQDPPIIYRDMKPGNVIVRPNGQVMMIDFGTAREFKNESQGDTTWLGTRGYAAPEQFGGSRQTDRSTDIYSLGATMYHLLTGYSPADTQFVIYPIGRFLPELSGSGLEKIIEKCCQPEPSRRYRNCKELLYDLEDADKSGVGKWLRRKKRMLVSILLIVLAGVAGAAGLTAYGARSARNAYLSCISAAENATDFITAAEYYKEAMRLRPEVSIAYEQMLSEMIEDGEITQKEKALMDESLQAVQAAGQSTMSNLMFFRKENPEEAAAFIYHLGRSCYAFFPDGQREANQYLKMVSEDRYLPEKDRKIANSLIAITEYYIYAGYLEGDHAWADADTQHFYSYDSLWTSLVTIISDPANADDQSGGPLFSLAVYRETATQITTNLQNFLDSGITKEEMEQALSAGKTYLSEHIELEKRISSQKLYGETKNALLNAENEMQVHFREIGNPQGN